MNLLNQTQVKKILFPVKAPKILVIEDDPSLSEILVDFFRSTGYVVYSFIGTEDILKLVEQFNPDLILLDYLLPKVNGGELCSQVKRNEETRHIPVIIYSALPKVMLSLGNYACDAFLPKPFDLYDLVDQIEILLARPLLNYQVTNFVT
jgi:DNA-binding response OmpR family regulator